MLMIGKNFKNYSSQEEALMTHIDMYGRTHELDDKSLGAIAARLEARRHSERYMAMLCEYLDAVDVSKAGDTLVLGCGTGVEVRELIQRPGFQSQVIAVDISPELIERAKTVFRHEGIASAIDWRVGDAQDLDLPDQRFDLIIAHTLISHVPDPESVVREAARLVRPGGTVIIFDGDYATLTFGADDPEDGRLADDKIISGLVANPRVMRSLPRMLRRLGLDLVGHRAWVLPEIGTADFYLSGLSSFSVLLPKAGVMTVEETEAFVSDQRQAHENGAFFASSNFYAMFARRPD